MTTLFVSPGKCLHLSRRQSCIRIACLCLFPSQTGQKGELTNSSHRQRVRASRRYKYVVFPLLQPLLFSLTDSLITHPIHIYTKPNKPHNQSSCLIPTSQLIMTVSERTASQVRPKHSFPLPHTNILQTVESVLVNSPTARSTP